MKQAKKIFCTFLAVLLVVFSAAPVMAQVTDSTPDFGNPAVHFYVPEAVYLIPTTAATAGVQYYLNSYDNSATTTLTAKETVGRLYFYCSDSTDVTVSYSISGGAGSVADLTTTGTTTIDDDSFTITGLNNTNAQIITWTATFTGSDDISRTVTSYTYVYKQNPDPTGAAVECKGNETTGLTTRNIYMGFLTLLWGANSSNTGSYGVKAAFKLTNGNGKPVLATANNVTPENAGFIGTGFSPKYVNYSYPGGAEVTVTSPTAFFYVDSSRFTNLNQVPNMYYGLTMTDDEETRDDDVRVYLQNSSGTTLATYHSKDDYGGETLIYQFGARTVDYAMSNITDGGSLTLRMQGYCVGDSDRTDAKGWCNINFTVYDTAKGNLRSAYVKEIKNGYYRQQGRYTSATWSTYVSAMKNAATVLGNPSATYANVTSAITTLDNAVSGLALQNYTQSLRHVLLVPTDPNSPTTGYIVGSLIETESIGSALFNTVTFEANTYTGSTFYGYKADQNDIVGTTTYTAALSGITRGGSPLSYANNKVSKSYTYYYIANSYNIMFMNADRTLLQSVYAVHNTIPVYTGQTPVMEDSDEYSYTFKGWTPEIVAATSAAVYTAVYEQTKIDKYDIIFKNDDGTVLQNTKWKYGTTPTYSETPTKEATAEYTYKFKGWSPAIVSVSGPAEYTAVYEAVKNEYNVYYKNYDGSAITEEIVLYGEGAQMAGALAPTKPASDGKTYIFAGWSADLSKITKNTYAVAQYAVEGVENHWVTFVDTDGTVLYKTMVEKGGTAVYGGEEVTKEGYEFVGWDKALGNITEDTTVTALYSKEGELYVVTYVDWDNTFIVSMIVNHGEDASAPSDPVREGDENTVYTFTGWDHDGTNITSNLVIKATYDVHSHEYNTFVENVISADCVTNRTDKFSCSCGLTKDIEIADSKDADNHTGSFTLTGANAVSCTEDGYTGDMVCDACGEVAEAGETINASGHTPGEAVKENEVTASCKEAAYYEEVVYCTVCGEELSRVPVTGEKLPHTEEEIPAVAPDCVNDGLTAGVKCSECGEILVAPETDTAKGHTPGEAVKENEVIASCKEAAYYEEVVYCTVCGEELSRVPVTGEKLPHTEEEIPAVAPDCVNDGLAAGVKCSVCGTVIKAQETDPKLGHDWGEWEVVTPATETENGLERRDCSRCEVYEERILYFADSGIIINALDTYYTGRTLPITATYNLSGKTVENATWVSSDERIVFFSDGRLIAFGTGEVTLTVTDGEFTATKTINVIEGGDARSVQFVNMDKMHFIIEDYYAIFDTAGFYWAEGEAIRFRVRAYSDFDFETYIVYVDGKAVEADENGYYTIPADIKWGIVTVQGAGFVEDEDGNVAKLSFWEMLIEFFRKIIAFFKGIFG